MPIALICFLALLFGTPTGTLIFLLFYYEFIAPEDPFYFEPEFDTPEFGKSFESD